MQNKSEILTKHSGLFLLIVALLSHFMTFGNPILEWDENFYLFGGGRLIHGYLPYIDFWDRKPFGLFLIYAFFHLFGPYRIIAYQLGALLSLWGTALLIRKTSLTIASPFGALVGAAIYEVWPILANGEGGQSPIFYNLLVAASMYLIVLGIPNFKKGNCTQIRNVGIYVMSLFGLSMQIKYTTIFEGVFSGIYLIYKSLKMEISLLNLSKYIIYWVSLAIIPTAFIFLFYIGIGHGDDWFFSNITSIFLRQNEGKQILLFRLHKILVLTSPFILPLVLNPIITKKLNNIQKDIFWFLYIWTLCSIFSIAFFGTWYTHYILPALLPLSIQISIFSRVICGKIFLTIILLIGIIASQLNIKKHLRTYGGKELFLTIEKSVNYGKDGCIFVYNGPVEIYDALPYCRLTSHPFPSHFSLQRENAATGMNPLNEITLILEKKPKYIITHSPEEYGENKKVRYYLYDNLMKNYTEVFKWTLSPKEGTYSVYKAN